MEKDYTDNSLVLINSIQRYMNDKNNKTNQIENRIYIKILHEFLQACRSSINSDLDILKSIMSTYQTTPEYKKNSTLYNDIFTDIQRILVHSPADRAIDHSTRTYIYID